MAIIRGGWERAGNAERRPSEGGDTPGRREDDEAGGGREGGREASRERASAREKGEKVYANEKRERR